LNFPSGFSQGVEGTLAGVDSDKSANLQIDSEGGIQPQAQNRVIVPLVLTLLAGRALLMMIQTKRQIALSRPMVSESWAGLLVLWRVRETLRPV
jgi:hypothetical protein